MINPGCRRCSEQLAGGLSKGNMTGGGGAKSAAFADREGDTGVRGVLIEHVMDTVRHQVNEKQKKSDRGDQAGDPKRVLV